MTDSPRPLLPLGKLPVAAFLIAASVATGCSTTPSTKTTPAEADTMTMAEMRLNEAGGPAKAATPQGLAHPVAEPSAPGPRALTDAGMNTPLGKEWVFTKVQGFDGQLPGPPKNASFLLGRENQRMVGTTSCNRMSAAFEINVVQATLSFDNIASTRALCGEPNINVEDAVIDALNATDAFLLDGKTLTLISKGATIATLTTP